jgi:hypothetical protein
MSDAGGAVSLRLDARVQQQHKLPPGSWDEGGRVWDYVGVDYSRFDYVPCGLPCCFEPTTLELTNGC